MSPIHAWYNTVTDSNASLLHLTNAVNLIVCTCFWMLHTLLMQSIIIAAALLYFQCIVQGKVSHYVFVASAGAYVPDGIHAGMLPSCTQLHAIFRHN